MKGYYIQIQFHHEGEIETYWYSSEEGMQFLTQEKEDENQVKGTCFSSKKAALAAMRDAKLLSVWNGLTPCKIRIVPLDVL